MMNLDPQLVAFEHQLLKGALVILPRPGEVSEADKKAEKTALEVLRFQYNPETIKRNRSGEWKVPKANAKNKKGGHLSTQQVTAWAAEGAGALLARSETIDIKIVFDTTEAVLAGRAQTELGVLPQLAVLEQVALGKQSASDTKSKKKKKGPQPIRPDELLLVLGTARKFPCVLTSLSITENRFTPQLVPTRAECDLKLKVLEPYEAKYNERIWTAFQELMNQRVERQAQALHSTGESKDSYSAIVNALYPAPLEPNS